MACYHPLMGIPKGIDPKSGKMQYLIKPYPKDYVEDKYMPGIIQVPCGKCIGCRLEYSRQWANRCMLELQYCDSAYFVTLTYNDWHVPRFGYVDEKTG